MGQVEEFRIVSVNVAQPAVLLRHPGGDVISSIAKQPVETPALELTRVNQLAGRPVETGFMGENLTEQD
jgi:hypothetical protein